MPEHTPIKLLLRFNELFHACILRFTAEEKAKRPQITYIPFGYGPRNCIGMRFAVLETKIAMLELLKSFSFVRAPDTQARHC